MFKKRWASILIAGMMFALPVEVLANETSVSIDSVNFPDEAFRMYVSDYFDTDNNDILSQAEKMSVTSIDLRGRGEISSLQGIENFENLESLNVQHTSINEINVGQNLELKNLDVSETSITTLEVGGNTKLTTLNCSATSISELNLESNVALETIKAKGVDLAELDLSESLNLRNFRFENSSIGAIYLPAFDPNSGWSYGFEGLEATLYYTFGDERWRHFTDQANMKWVAVWDDNISKEVVIEINSDNFPNEALRTFVSDNFDVDGVEGLSQYELNKIGYLDIYGSSMKDFTGVQNFPNLYRVSISGNVGDLDLSSISTLGEVCVSEATIGTLDLSGLNELDTVEVIELSKIDTLDISDTSVENIFIFGGDVSDIDINEDHGHFKLIDKALIKADGTMLIYSLHNKGDVFTLPPTVTHIWAYAFSGWENGIEEVVLPEGVTTINDSIFDSSNVSKVTIPSTITEMPASVVGGKTDLGEIRFTGDAPQLGPNFYRGDYDGVVKFYYPKDANGWEAEIAEYSAFAYEGFEFEFIAYEKQDEGADVTTDTIQKLIDSQTDKKNISLKTEDSDIEFSKEAIALITSSELETVTVTTGNTTITLDLSTMKEIQKLGVDVTVSAKVVDKSQLSESVQELVGDRPVFDFTITGADGRSIFDFGGGTAKVTLPYTLGSNENAENLVIYYIDGETVKEIDVDSYKDGKITFSTSHFSIYGVGYRVENIPESTPETTPKTEGDTAPQTGDVVHRNLAIYMVLLMMSISVAIMIKRVCL